MGEFFSLKHAGNRCFKVIAIYFILGQKITSIEYSTILDTT